MRRHQGVVAHAADRFMHHRLAAYRLTRTLAARSNWPRWWRPRRVWSRSKGRVPSVDLYWRYGLYKVPTAEGRKSAHALA
jgi:hypothetical protein